MLLSIITKAFAFSDSNADAVACAWALTSCSSCIVVTLGLFATIVSFFPN